MPLAVPYVRASVKVVFVSPLFAMFRFNFIVVMIAMLRCSCSGQMIEEVQEILILKNVVDGINDILEKFKESKATMEGNVDELRTKLASFEETQKTMHQTLQDLHTKMTSVEVQLQESQHCAKADQIEALQSLSESGQQEIMTKLQQSSCRNDLLEFQDLLTKDECTDRSHNCSEKANCTDSLVLYKCDCLPGYYGDGFTCTEPDCNSPSIYLQDLGCVSPILTRLSWMDAKRKCESKGLRLLQNLKAEHFEPLSIHFRPFMEDRPFPWIGFTNNKWISSGHSVVSELVARGEVALDGECGNIDFRPGKRGLWDATCDVKDYALCQTIL